VKNWEKPKKLSYVWRREVLGVDRLRVPPKKWYKAFLKKKLSVIQRQKGGRKSPGITIND